MPNGFRPNKQEREEQRQRDRNGKRRGNSGNGAPAQVDVPIVRTFKTPPCPQRSEPTPAQTGNQR